MMKLLNWRELEEEDHAKGGGYIEHETFAKSDNEGTRIGLEIPKLCVGEGLSDFSALLERLDFLDKGLRI